MSQDQVEAFNQMLREITESRADQEESGLLDPRVRCNFLDWIHV